MTASREVEFLASKIAESFDRVDLFEKATGTEVTDYAEMYQVYSAPHCGKSLVGDEYEWTIGGRSCGPTPPDSIAQEIRQVEKQVGVDVVNDLYEMAARGEWP